MKNHVTIVARIRSGQIHEPIKADYLRSDSGIRIKRWNCGKLRLECACVCVCVCVCVCAGARARVCVFVCIFLCKSGKRHKIQNTHSRYVFFSSLDHFVSNRSLCKSLNFDKPLTCSAILTGRQLASGNDFGRDHCSLASPYSFFMRRLPGKVSVSERILVSQRFDSTKVLPSFCEPRQTVCLLKF